MKISYSLSLDIGTSYIKVLYGRKSFRRIKLKTFGVLDTPEGAFKSGEILVSESICAKINEFIKDNRIKPRNVSYVLHSREIISRNLNIPMMNYKNLDLMVKWEMNQFVNGAINDYYLRYEVVERTSISYKILAVIVPKRILDKYLKLSKDLNLKLKYIDVAPKCVQRFFKGAGNSIAVIDLGSGSIRMSIYDNGDLYMDKEFIHGHDDFKSMKLIDDRNLDINPCKDSIGNCFKQFEKIMEYYISNNSRSFIDKIFFIGGGSLIGSYKTMATKYFMISSIKEEFTDAKYSYLKEEFRENINMYINCLGLLMRKG